MMLHIYSDLFNEGNIPGAFFTGCYTRIVRLIDRTPGAPYARRSSPHFRDAFLLCRSGIRKVLGDRGDSPLRGRLCFCAGDYVFARETMLSIIAARSNSVWGVIAFDSVLFRFDAIVQ